MYYIIIAEPEGEAADLDAQVAELKIAAWYASGS